jgi:hypothetical protein
MTDFPQKIKFLSDDTELEFVEKCFFEKKKSNDKLAKYIYTKAEVNLGKEIVFNLEQLIYLESCYLLKVVS